LGLLKGKRGGGIGSLLYEGSAFVADLTVGAGFIGSFNVPLFIEGLSEFAVISSSGLRGSEV
jgi:hypothetical protein